MIVIGAFAWLVIGFVYSLVVCFLCLGAALAPGHRARIVLGSMVFACLLAPVGCTALVKTRAVDSLAMAFGMPWGLVFVAAVTIAFLYGSRSRQDRHDAPEREPDA